MQCLRQRSLAFALNKLNREFSADRALYCTVSFPFPLSHFFSRKYRNFNFNTTEFEVSLL